MRNEKLEIIDNNESYSFKEIVEMQRKCRMKKKTAAQQQQTQRKEENKRKKYMERASE